MQKVDYNKTMKETISGFKGAKPSILLHSCCGPCSSWVLNRLKDYFDITVLFYNPNIFPEAEYLKRKQEQLKVLNILNIKFLDCDYNEQEFLCEAKGLENEKEGGARCSKCFYLRLNYTAKKAKENGFEFFGTTLTVSPHKNAFIINNIGASLEEKLGVKYLISDFKKENGYLNSINLSKEYNLYRQDYCGCRYSKNF